MAESVAVLGAGGTMGFPMARNLARAAIEVRAWNRSREKAEPLTEDGARVFEVPAEAAHGASVVLTILADADAVLQTIKAAAAGIGADAIWLQMSTIGEEATDRCAEFARAHAMTLVDAPVLGTKQPAEQGKLVVLASGPAQVRDRVQPIFDALGQKTIWIGEAGAGTRLKMTEGCAEAFALAEGLGLDPALLLDAVEGGALDLPYLRMKGKAILERNFEPFFRLKLAAKDARLIDESARRHHLEVPLFSAIRRQMSEAAKEHGDEDMAATYFASAPAAR
jgi:3-hydroxyisobutyrate dehydrogenase